MNMFVCFQISPFVERRIPGMRYGALIFALWMLTVGVTFPFMHYPTLGFSGIMLGLLTFTIGLYRHQREFAKTLLGWLGINIAIGLLPQISFVGHLGGAFAGALLFGLYFLAEKIRKY
jgi:membrane associated rhomboid family serine protease